MDTNPPHPFLGPPSKRGVLRNAAPETILDTKGVFKRVRIDLVLWPQIKTLGIHIRASQKVRLDLSIPVNHLVREYVDP